MNNKFKSFCAALAVGASAFCLPPAAVAQVTATTQVVLTNIPTLIAGAATSNLFTFGTLPTNNIITVRQGYGFACADFFTVSNAASTGGVSVNWAGSLDGTNYFLIPGNQLTNIGIGNASGYTNIFGTNFAGSTINNFGYITPYSIQNANASTNNISGFTLTVGVANVVPPI